MRKNILGTIVFLSILLLFTGCRTISPKSPEPLAADSLLSMPDNAFKIVLAISTEILDRGDRVENVAFNSIAPVKLPSAEMFTLERSTLLTYNENEGTLSAELFFKDTIGRVCAFLTNAEFTVNGKNIKVKRYSVSEKYMAAERAASFVIPADTFNNFTKENLPDSFYSLYQYAGKRSVTPKEAEKYRGKRDWTVLVFALDRIAKPSGIRLELSNQQKRAKKGHDVFTRYINYSGWRVCVISGKFHLLEPDSDKPLYANLFLTSGPGFVKRMQMTASYRLR